MDACKPLRPQDRNAFLVALSIELGRERQLGPGIVHRTCRNLQRQFRDPPNLHGLSSTTADLARGVGAEAVAANPGKSDPRNPQRDWRSDKTVGGSSNQPPTWQRTMLTGRPTHQNQGSTKPTAKPIVACAM